MIALTVILSIFLVLLVFVVGFVIIGLLKNNHDLTKELNDVKSDNKKLKDDNKDLDDMLKTLQNKPSMVGISYKTDNDNVKKIMEEVANVYEAMQDAACTLKSKTADQQTAAFLAKFKADSSKTSCADIKTTNNSAIDTYVNDLVADTNIPSNDATFIKNAIKSLVLRIIEAVCTSSDNSGSTIDTSKLKALLKDVFEAICTNV